VGSDLKEEKKKKEESLYNLLFKAEKAKESLPGF